MDAVLGLTIGCVLLGFGLYLSWLYIKNWRKVAYWTYRFLTINRKGQRDRIATWATYVFMITLAILDLRIIVGGLLIVSSSINELAT